SGVLLQVIEALACEPCALFIYVNGQQLVAGHFEGVHDLMRTNDRDLVFDGTPAKQDCDDLFCQTTHCTNRFENRNFPPEAFTTCKVSRPTSDSMCGTVGPSASK